MYCNILYHLLCSLDERSLLLREGSRSSLFGIAFKLSLIDINVRQVCKMVQKCGL
jgi:hypothetical protein